MEVFCVELKERKAASVKWRQLVSQRASESEKEPDEGRDDLLHSDQEAAKYIFCALTLF